MNNPKISTKPIYTNPNPKRFSTGDIIWEGVKGFGQGVLGGIEHGINTISLGLYDVANDAFFDGGYEKRQRELESLADDVNLGKAYKYANYAIDIGADSLLGTKAVKGTKNLLNKTKQLFN